MIIEGAVEISIPRLMQKTDCYLLREEEISSVLARSCESILKDIGVPNHTKFVQVEKLYPASTTRTQETVDIFIDKKAVSHFSISTSELYHNTLIECKFLKHDNSSPWNIKPLVTDMRKLLNKGKGFAYLIILMHHDLKNHTKRSGQKELLNLFLSTEQKTIVSIFDSLTNIENDENLPTVKSDDSLIEIKIRRNFSDIFPLNFGTKDEYYKFVTLKFFANGMNTQGYCFGGV